jgi:hypothetical protein
MEHDSNRSWSHDEKIAALSIFEQFKHVGGQEWIDKIPVFGSPWGNSSWLSYFRPDVLAYTLMIKYRWTQRFLYWIIELKVADSLKDFKKNPKKESSGVQKAFIMLMGLGKWEEADHIKETIGYAMDIYYPEEDHPIRKVWNER